MVVLSASTKTNETWTNLIAGAFNHAIALAGEQEGATAPNPTVGCVLLDAAGSVLSAAAHLGPGKAHAEVKAIELAREAGVLGRIDTVIVTLEPCNHVGRTGPCSAAILATPARKVWYGLPDPNIMAAGGIERLKAAGLQVEPLSSLAHKDTPELLKKLRRQLAPFLTRILLGRPFVTVKQAVDLSGSMIPPIGQKTFTSATSLTLAHQLRRRADAIFTGSGTVIADRPEFTVRHIPDITGKERALCIFDRRGRIDQEYLALAKSRGFGPRVVVDIGATLRQLATEGCNEVLVEAGPELTGSIQEVGLWDEWVLIEKMPFGQSDRITLTSRNSAELSG